MPDLLQTSRQRIWSCLVLLNWMEYHPHYHGGHLREGRAVFIRTTPSRFSGIRFCCRFPASVSGGRRLLHLFHRHCAPAAKCMIRLKIFISSATTDCLYKRTPAEFSALHTKPWSLPYSFREPWLLPLPSEVLSSS